MSVFFSYAFRPFFLLNALFAAAVMGLWIAVLHGGGPAFLPANVAYWHAHEMLVGFAMAALAGFVLTAVATWTGRDPVRGLPLALLVCAWLAGRMAMLWSGALPGLTVFAVDMLFPVLLVMLLAREVLAVRSQRNYKIIYVVAFLAFLNALYHLGVTGYLPMFLDAERAALYLQVHTLLLLVTVIGGRIIPNFTTNWLRARAAQCVPRTSPLLERAVLGATAAAGLFATFAPLSRVTAGLALLAGGLHAMRLAGWCGVATRSEPLLFVLHVAYLWLPLGYLLTALASAGLWVPPTAALHAFTVGAIGTMILAVTSRVALAHTGRPLRAPKIIVAGYIALCAAACARIVSPFGSWYLPVLDIASLLWIGAFLLFAVCYAPILLRPALSSTAK